jgi:hypothetical protein
LPLLFIAGMSSELERERDRAERTQDVVRDSARKVVERRFALFMQSAVALDKIRVSP